MHNDILYQMQVLTKKGMTRQDAWKDIKVEANVTPFVQDTINRILDLEEQYQRTSAILNNR